MNEFAAWFNLLLVTFVGSLVIFLIYYRWRYGPRLTVVLTLRSLILVITFFAVAFLYYSVLTFPSDLLLYVVGGATILVPLFFLIRLIVLQPKPDGILLDLDDADDANLGVQWFVGALLVGDFLTISLHQYSDDPAKLAFTLLVTVGLVLVFILSLGYRVRSTCLTAEALYLRGNRIKWVDVKEYHWERLPSGKEALSIHARGFLPIFDQFVVRVPSPYKELFSGYLGRFASQTAPLR